MPTTTPASTRRQIRVLVRDSRLRRRKRRRTVEFDVLPTDPEALAGGYRIGAASHFRSQRGAWFGAGLMASAALLLGIGGSQWSSLIAGTGLALAILISCWSTSQQARETHRALSLLAGEDPERIDIACITSTQPPAGGGQ